MTDYIIKNYQNGFEEEQEKIGIEVAKSFITPHQTPVERLRQIYSQENFDSNTRLYAFKGDKMVGFLTSRVLDDDETGIKKANLTLPSVLPEHKEAWKMLYDKAIDVLKEKKVKKIQTWFGCIACKPIEEAEKMGYNTILSNNYFLYNVDLSEIDQEVSTEKVVNFDFEKHHEGLIPIIIEEYDRNEEWARNYLEQVRTGSNTANRFLQVIEDNGVIKGFFSLNINRIEPSIGTLQVIHAKSEDYMKQLLSKIAKIAEEKGCKQIQIGYTNESDIKQEKYQPIKFVYLSSAVQYIKDL
ncbi:MAG: hypothetical protein EAX90_11205 [Candidatus Heimdallarchaeota archaeon]|nr:hypothetical protein [Candidatus Heimdallarchaeota archaeon]